jgi:hypothetical protein
MLTRNGHTFVIIVVGLTTGSIILPSCAPHLTAMPTLPPTAIIAPTVTPTIAPTPVPFPAVTLNPGDSYFSIDGRQSFLLSRNITGKTWDDLHTLLEWAHQGGSKVVRVHLTHGWWGDPWINKDWSVNEKWAQDWDRFFDEAQADGISVIPVFGVWADWNNGTPDWGSPLWQYNPLNLANGGPVSSPGDLFISNSATQSQWMEWVKTLVKRWQGRQNIAAWEIFSELDIASSATGHMDTKGGVDEATGVDFTNNAMAVIHTADSQHRPVTLSVAGVYSSAGKWTEYYNLDSLDFVEVHYYSDTLDRDLVSQVRKYLAKYQKPVLIGESGLWSMTHKANAHIGIEHAIWADLVSGAMNGRALWDNDGYSLYSISNRANAMAFMQTYATTELSVANFTNGVDFSGFKPLVSTSSPGVWGAAVGNESMVLGWYRDASSEPPNWNLRPMISKQTVILTVPGSVANWKIDFYNTKTGTDIVSSTMVARKGDKVTLTLPDFADDIAFKMHIQK